jgi:hypothetical protein
MVWQIPAFEQYMTLPWVRGAAISYERLIRAMPRVIVLLQAGYNGMNYYMETFIPASILRTVGMVFALSLSLSLSINSLFSIFQTFLHKKLVLAKRGDVLAGR